jgi:hypothetical protein
MVSIGPNGMGVTRHRIFSSVRTEWEKGKRWEVGSACGPICGGQNEEIVNSMSFKITNVEFSFYSTDILIGFSWTWQEQHSSLVNHRFSCSDKWHLVFLRDKHCVWLLLQLKETGEIIQSGMMIRSCSIGSFLRSAQLHE